jgi:hypothetical protein
MWNNISFTVLFVFVSYSSEVDTNLTAVSQLQAMVTKDRIGPTNHLYFFIIMALYPFVGPSPLFQILDPIDSRNDSLYGGSAQNTENNTNTE